MATKTINVSFPKKTLEEIDRFAEREDLSRSDVLRIGAKKYIRDFAKWQILQSFGKKQAENLGFKSEEEIVRALEG